MRRPTTNSTPSTPCAQDMESDRPMDRLICGDVGYGKTEVAVRAAFKAIMDGKQVALLVPTTVLAQQHYRNLSARLSRFPVRVEMLSRFRTPAQQEKIIQGLGAGTMDMVVGTHRILSQRPGLQGSGHADHRRGAALWRGAKGKAQTTARPGRRADAQRHAHPAHAAHEPQRHPRHEHHHHAAQRAAARPHRLWPNTTTYWSARPSNAN